MAKTKYSGVYQDKNGKFFYQLDLGLDKETGKRIQIKSRKDEFGNPFKSALAANKELIRIKILNNKQGRQSNYNLLYKDFMKQYYIPHYKVSVERSTWESRESGLKDLTQRFSEKKLRDISIIDCEQYRVWLLKESGYSQSYCSLLYGMFRKTLDYAVSLEFLNQNISKKTKAISKGKSVVPFWTKEEFEKVLSSICIDEFYEHMSFVMLWVYYMTGIRVSEGLALTWSDIDFKKKKMKIHHTLEMKNQSDFKRKPYTKTASGMRTISLDDDTIKILRRWKQIQEEHNVHTFIFSYTDFPLYRSTVQRIIQRYAKIADVHTVQGKGLRHSHVSYLINEFNTDILVVSQRLGHSGPEITLKHYAHLWSRNDESIAEKMTGNIIFKTSKVSKINFNGNQVVKK